MDTNQFIHNLLKNKGVEITPKNNKMIDEFISNSETQSLAIKILDTQSMILDKYKIANRIFEIQNIPITLPNATVKKEYSAKIDLKALKIDDIIKEEFEELEGVGLKYNIENNTLEGIPTKSGDLKIKFFFKIKGESDDSPLNEKIITLVVNPNPRDLWSKKDSDKNDIFAKPDDPEPIFDKIGDKSIIISSKRGRSHANVGSFRDDDFAYKHFENTGWSLVVISDGAGSASLSRKGSQLACNSVVEYFDNYFGSDQDIKFELLVEDYILNNSEERLNEIKKLSKYTLWDSTLFVHKKIKEFADNLAQSKPELFNNPKSKSNIDYFHSTLIFCLFKKYNFGYLIQTFGVGDCPIAVMNNDKTETSLLNWLDVGEHGGGTRFITQPDIFQKQEVMSTRFNLKIIDDFSFLFLMTDGIYDAKFVVEANLEKNEKWLEFLDDLNGKNEDNIKVDFEKNNKETANELSDWMNFWSVGNHDDRTLAIIF